VSAHWYLSGVRVTAMDRPRTIHDFGGFPPELYRVRYPAPGDPGLARRVAELLAPRPVALDHDWGLDHGTWSVLCHVFPQADVPVVQLAIDEAEPPEFHYALARRLAPLRDEGVLVVGSGNLVHNLHAYAWGRHPVEPFDWAVRFEGQARRLLEAGDHGPLVAYESLGGDALLSVPTPEHFLPLLYVAALARPGEPVRFPVEGVDGGSVSMLTVQVG
jgi:4,5-DOPA dioxygenase extradiol